MPGRVMSHIPLYGFIRWGVNNLGMRRLPQWMREAYRLAAGKESAWRSQSGSGGSGQSARPIASMNSPMPNPNGMEFLLVSFGGAIMFYVMLKAIGQGAMAVAAEEIDERRAEEARRQAEDAAAEAAGRAAALEPLEVNADGTIAEPILGVVEEPS